LGATEEGTETVVGAVGLVPRGRPGEEKEEGCLPQMFPMLKRVEGGREGSEGELVGWR
jgi:hypothetical protein